MQKLPITEKSHGCECGHDHDVPELDARVIPHAIRHGAIFGALSQLPVGGTMILIAPHNPVPLLTQIEDRAPGAYSVSYLKKDPEDWRIAFQRVV